MGGHRRNADIGLSQSLASCGVGTLKEGVALSLERGSHWPLAPPAEVFANLPERGVSATFQAASDLTRLDQEVAKRVLPLPPLRVGVASDGEELSFPTPIRAAALFARFG